jgi:hypothetical protein
MTPTQINTVQEVIRLLDEITTLVHQLAWDSGDVTAALLGRIDAARATVQACLETPEDAAPACADGTADRRVGAALAAARRRVVWLQEDVAVVAYELRRAVQEMKARIAELDPACAASDACRCGGRQAAGRADRRKH